jgi:hypothetical protein
MRLTELVEAIDFLRKAGWTVEPPKKRRARASLIGEPERVGRPSKNGRRKRRRRRKSKNES